ncbi:MAG: glycyl-radical enzyme activating protein [Desulfovibrio sp.]|uniref:glycyl-radical enzyme activating protein n=1 Tax=Desulfovibrio sp. TaxID=885 RepID=UPI001A6890BB|nr:glycyl-radical enzyme activating protein [Desulfovibrio sp.]MBD5416526.1 glycyl-radical enzyme activating protein [Desulfovibrio sp.]
MASSAELRGEIFNIQKFSVHDGSGIRTTVFLKGCPLHCKWCCNPESQATGPVYSRNMRRCHSCGACVKTCPQGAVAMEGGRLHRDADACTLCGHCAEICPRDAISIIGKTVSVAEVIRQVADDALFYRDGGGMTLSGGEALLQPEFAEALCREAHMHGLSTAMETSLAVPYEHAARVCAHLDELMADVKHMSPKHHKEATGQDNVRILDNIRTVSEDFPALPILLRCPVIPGFNDSDAHVEELARFVASIRGARLELLPYHRLGADKYENIGLEYGLADVNAPAKEKMRRLREVAAKYVEIV